MSRILRSVADRHHSAIARPAKTKEGPAEAGPSNAKSGGDLLSQGESTQVPSAQSGLTSVFGMGTGVTQTR